MAEPDEIDVDFIAHPPTVIDTGAASRTVSFYNKTMTSDLQTTRQDSTWQEYGWEWDFGDGSSKSYIENPSHTYPENTVPGTTVKYTVTLQVFVESSTYTKTKTDYIWIVNDAHLEPPRQQYDNHHITSIFIGGPEYNDGIYDNPGGLYPDMVLNRTPSTPRLPTYGGVNAYFTDLELYNTIDRNSSAKFKVWNWQLGMTDNNKYVLSEGSQVHIINGMTVVWSGVITRVTQGKTTFFREDTKEVSWDIECEGFLTWLRRMPVLQYYGAGNYVDPPQTVIERNCSTKMAWNEINPYEWELSSYFNSDYPPTLVNWKGAPAPMTPQNMRLPDLVRTLFQASNFDWRFRPMYWVAKYDGYRLQEDYYYPGNYAYCELFCDPPLPDALADIYGGNSAFRAFIVQPEFRDGSRNTNGILVWGIGWVSDGNVRFDFDNFGNNSYAAWAEREPYIPESGHILLLSWPVLEIGDTLAPHAPAIPGQFVINRNMYEFDDKDDRYNFGTLLKVKTEDEKTGAVYTSSLTLDKQFTTNDTSTTQKFYGMPYITFRTDGYIHKLPAGTTSNKLYLKGWGYGFSNNGDINYRDKIYIRRTTGTWDTFTVGKLEGPVGDEVMMTNRELTDTDEARTKYTEVTLYTNYTIANYAVGNMAIGEKIRVNVADEGYSKVGASFLVGMERVLLTSGLSPPNDPWGNDDCGPYLRTAGPPTSGRGYSGSQPYPHGPGTTVGRYTIEVGAGNSPYYIYGEIEKNLMNSAYSLREEADAVCTQLAWGQPMPWRKATAWCWVQDFWKKVLANRYSNITSFAFPEPGDLIEVLKYETQTPGERVDRFYPTYWQIISYTYNADSGVIKLELGDVERTLNVQLASSLTPIQRPLK